MQLDIRDEVGNVYQVKPGDPAAKMVSALKARGFRQIRLPREALLLGTLPVMETQNYRIRDCVEVLSAGT